MQSSSCTSDSNDNMDVKETPVEIDEEETLRLEELVLAGDAVDSTLERLVKVYLRTGHSEKMLSLIKNLKPRLQMMSKPKAGKLVRSLIDTYLDTCHMVGDKDVQVVANCVEWAREEHRLFLRQALEVKLIRVYYEAGHHHEALKLSSNLRSELKRLDDKQLLIDVCLWEAKIYQTVGNIPKARAALTSARTTASSVYVPATVQGQLDLQAGLLHGDVSDFATAQSYFMEAFEQFDMGDEDNDKALTALKYLKLAKLMQGKPDIVVKGEKTGEKYAHPILRAIEQVATAIQNRSLVQFQDILKKYSCEFEKDPVIKKHVEALYESILQENLLCIIEPYSRVQIQWIAQKIDLPQQDVERKLSRMILDRKLCGVLDQEAGVVVVFADEKQSDLHKNILQLVIDMSRVLDKLYHLAHSLY